MMNPSPARGAEARVDRRAIPQTRELLSLAGALIIVLTIGFLAYKNWTDLQRSTEELRTSRQIQQASMKLLSAVKDAETGQRGYLLTGTDAYLEPYQQALSKITDASGELVRVSAGHPDQLARAKAVLPLAETKLAELKKTIELRRSRGLDAALSVVSTGQGKALMDGIRTLCDSIETGASDRISESTAAAHASASELGFVSTAGCAVLFVMLLAASANIQRSTRAREQLIEQIAEDRDWLRITLNSIGDAVIATDGAGRVTLLNPVAEELTGWRSDAAEGVPVEQILVINHEQTGATVDNPVTKVIQEDQTVALANHTILTARDGRKVPIEDSAAPIRDRNGQIAGVILVFRDVTQRQQAERRAAELGEKFRFMAESMPEKIFTATPAGEIDYFNQQWPAFTGRPLERSVDWWAQFIHPEDLDQNVREWRRSLATGEPFRLVHRFRRADGEYRWHLSRAHAMRDLAGNVSMWIGSNTEIHEQRETEAELRSVNQDLEQFAYSASHDLQEPIRNVAVYSEILGKRFGNLLDEEGQQFLSFVSEGSRRASRLINDLLAYTRAGTVEASLTKIDATGIMKESLNALAEAIRESEATVTSDPLPEVYMGETHLQQLFQNIIGNAIKYRREEAPRIHVSAAEVNGDWRFSVQDNGIGIDPQYRENIFGVFKRLHHDSKFSGTGIGLAICQRVVVRYGGRIWVESETGSGATFFFTVPKHAHRDKAAAESSTG